MALVGFPWQLHPVGLLSTGTGSSEVAPSQPLGPTCLTYFLIVLSPGLDPALCKNRSIALLEGHAATLRHQVIQWRAPRSSGMAKQNLPLNSLPTPFQRIWKTWILSLWQGAHIKCTPSYPWFLGSFTGYNFGNMQLLLDKVELFFPYYWNFP